VTDKEIDLAIIDAERTLTFVGSATVLAHSAFEVLERLLAAAKVQRERLDDANPARD
jgi:hypothetical protein